MIANFSYRVVDVRIVNALPPDTSISLQMSLQRKIDSFEAGVMHGSFRLIIAQPGDIDSDADPEDFLVRYEISFVAENSDKDIDADTLIISAENLVYSNMRAEINSLMSAVGMSPLGLPLFTRDFKEGC